MMDLAKPENFELLLYDVVGHIPASEKTPDIYYCEDPSSEKVAALTFLTLWFFDPHIQQLVKQRAEAVICGLSPLSGGKRLETAFSKAKTHTTDLANKLVSYDFSTAAGEYAGTCHYPEWTENGAMVRKGYLAIYATSLKNDEKNGYTARWREKSRPPRVTLPACEQDDLYQFLAPRRQANFGVHTILESFSLPHGPRERRLADIFKSEFSDIDSLFDMIPKRVAHEVAHLLEHGHDLIPTPEIHSEIEDSLPRHNAMLSHYRPPSEAVAELAGIVLLNQVQRNTSMNFGIPTTMLDKFLPNAYDEVEKKIERISGCPEPR